MYQYDTYDQAMVDARVEEFRDQVKRRLEGKMTEEQFRPLRLMNGLYLQLHAYMLRVAIPYGTLERGRCGCWAISRASTTRATATSPPGRTSSITGSSSVMRPTSWPIWPSVEMHAIQTSGNCIRNITVPTNIAGAAADEIADPRPWAELLRQWSSFHPEFSFCRASSRSRDRAPEDRAAMRCTTSGCELVRKKAGDRRRVFVGGGMGRTPMIAPLDQPVRPAGRAAHLCRGCLRVYNRYGRRDNKYKARIKILVHELGADEYRRQVAEEFAHLKTLGIRRLWPNWSGSSAISPIRLMMHAACRRPRPLSDPISRSGSTAIAPAQAAGLCHRQYQPEADSAASPAMRPPSRSM
jgi:sulfite reductase (NADPH) hemoprotein beta-component